MRTERYSIKGYKINYATNTISMNYKFAKAAEDYGSPEYNLMQNLRADFPTMKLIVEAGRKITTVRPTKRLTYQNMMTHMSCYKNSHDLIKQFEAAQRLSKPLASPYKYVRDWFEKQFPDYRDVNASLSKCGYTVKLVKLPDTNDYEPREKYDA